MRIAIIVLLGQNKENHVLWQVFHKVYEELFHWCTTGKYQVVGCHSTNRTLFVVEGTLHKVLPHSLMKIGVDDTPNRTRSSNTPHSQGSRGRRGEGSIGEPNHAKYLEIGNGGRKKEHKSE